MTPLECSHVRVLGNASVGEGAQMGEKKTPEQEVAGCEDDDGADRARHGARKLDLTCWA